MRLFAVNHVTFQCWSNFSLSLFQKTVNLYPFQIHSIFLSSFGSLIGPFGGFFASGFKRAFKIKVKNISDSLSLCHFLSNELDKLLVLFALPVCIILLFQHVLLDRVFTESQGRQSWRTASSHLVFSRKKIPLPPLRPHSKATPQKHIFMCSDCRSECMQVGRQRGRQVGQPII